MGGEISADPRPGDDRQDVKTLAELIRSAVKDSIGSEKKVGLLFSGGVDSTCLAIAARKHARVTLYLVGTPDSHDMRWGREAAYTLDLPIVEVGVTEENVLASLKDLVRNHGLGIPRWTTTFIGFNIAVPLVNEELIMSGQGADELFGGYRKYGEMSREEAERTMLADLRELRDEEVPLYQKIAASRGKGLEVPFLDKDLADFAAEIPLNQKLTGNRNKAIFRDAVKVLGVPEAVAERPKKAMQYGSGISKILKAYLKDAGQDLSELMIEIKT
jgi:asparagine synthase (glutamine-hydrolysing)